jgi:Protein of unknown function (DUF993)
VADWNPKEKRRDKMTEQILLPHADGSLEPYAPGKHAVLEEPPGPPKSRIAYAAAHVVADPLEQFANRVVLCKDVAHGDLLEGPKNQGSGRGGSGHS